MIGYINAGGRGTRLGGAFPPHPEKGIAKALLEIGSPPIKLIDHHIANLRGQNIELVVVAAGDQQEVYEYAHDVYAHDGDVEVTSSNRQLGTGGDLVNYAHDSCADTPLLVQNVDTILDIGFARFTDEFRAQRGLGAVASIALTQNQGVPNEGAYLVDSNALVVGSGEFGEGLSERAFSYRASSTGAVIIDPEFLRTRSWNTTNGQLSLYKDCLRAAWQQNGLFAYNNQRRFFRDVGTVATWLASQGDIELQSQLRYD